MKYDIILFDADDTLFDFQKTAEKNFKNTCEKLGVPYKDGYYEIYRDINQGYWDLYSVGKVEKAVLKKMRFVDFGKAVGVTINAEEFMPVYEKGLSEIAILYPDTATVLEKIKNMDFDSAKNELLKIKGVGEKVAQCSLLYGFGRMEAFPVDVWVKRIVEELYPDGLPECIKGTEGIAQQYLFHWRRNLKDEEK